MAEQGIVQIQGLAELHAELDKLSDRLAKNSLVGGVRAAARAIQIEARKKAPAYAFQAKMQINRGHRGAGKGKKPEYITIPPGYLRKSISVWRVRDRDTKYAVAFKTGVRPPNKGKFPYYGIFLEREKGTSKMKAQPFLRPAFDSTKEAAIEAMKTYLAGRIQKELDKP